ncbi:INH1 subunit of the mitochondrial F1F0 ATP synthase [Mycena venus]|uniref:ATPase inhibitor, mitochondrial n=1 Tax=Mycena venus TaxID=2733690 RepID=A0A8H6XQ26_9AGAR|nr:INH1 subunit of the mitochondrial F1F0 ATP synthase [Mycena venus]
MLSRISVVRRLPQLTATSKRFTSSLKEGSVAQSKGFSEKERAHENEYARRQEQQSLAKLKAEIERKKTELDQLQAEHDAELRKAGKE